MLGKTNPLSKSSVGVDFGVAQDFSLGGIFSYRNNGENYQGTNYDRSLLAIGFNGNYHFDNMLDLPSDWNVYGGLTLAYYRWSNVVGYNGNLNSGINLEAQIGTRYFFSESFGINLEVGGGTFTGGKFGITKKF